MFWLILRGFVTGPDSNITIAPWPCHERRKEALASSDRRRLLYQRTGIDGFYRKISPETGLLLWKRVQTLPLSKSLRKSRIFLKCFVVNSQKVPIFADSLQKRIYFTIRNHGKSL